ncbi:MAG: sigma-70 family RNA polymerase sigma factor [Chloroflexi bacterium]|nr:sigma-70 family RNA polymerase sigma factor [Chloroflexota bacterium]MBP8056018.1 sigma-70 family RNA polymerase sigma factor [Chloroflexota bacterium]
MRVIRYLLNVVQVTDTCLDMTTNEPTPAWQIEQHYRILKQEPTAFAELCELALPHLVSFLQRLFSLYEPHLCEQVAIDCLLHYQATPQQYDPTKLALWPFLRMAAKRDMLNLLDKQQRHNQHFVPLDDSTIQQQLFVEETLPENFALDEWLQQYTSRSRQEIIAFLEAELTEPDKEILFLMMEGVRDSQRYAEIMNILHLDAAAQQSEVKRAKDRLVKKLRRFGQRL